MELKDRIAREVRALDGWAAEVEAVDQVAGRWRADVLAKGPKGDLVGFEVQCSDIRRTTAQQRTDRMRASMVQPVWVAPRRWASLDGLPGVIVEPVKDYAVLVGVERWGQQLWTPRHLPLGGFVRRVCVGRLIWVAEPRPWAGKRSAWTSRKAMNQANRDAKRLGYPAEGLQMELPLGLASFGERVRRRLEDAG